MNRSFAYIYDDFLADTRFERPLAAVEAELSRLGINGRTVRMGMFRDPRDLTSDLVRGGVNTVVVIGNDQTLLHVLWFLAPLGVCIGYIPMAPSHAIADLLRIPKGAAAVDVIGARYIEALDVGMLDGQAFLTEVVIPDGRARLTIGTYALSPVDAGGMAIRNIGSLDQGVSEDARDGQLIAVIQSEGKKTGSWPWAKRAYHETRVPFTAATLAVEKTSCAYIDGRKIPGKTYALEVSPGMLKVITGRLRKK